MPRLILALCIALALRLAPALATEGNAPGATKRTRATIPYREDREGRPLIEAGLGGGAKGLFVFDTGTNVNVITRAMAAKLGLTPEPAIKKDGNPARFPNGTPVFEVRVQALGLGDLSFPRERFAVIPAERFGNLIGEPIDGIIGVRAVCESAVVMDFARKVLTVWHPAPLTEEDRREAGLGGVIGIPMIDPSGQFEYHVKGRLNGEIDEEFLIDTGAPQTTISHQSARQLKLPLDGPSHTFRLPFRTVESKGTRLASLKVGNEVVGNLEVQVPVKDGPQTTPVLGLDVLSRFRVLIDYEESKLYLAPRATMKCTGEPETS